MGLNGILNKAIKTALKAIAILLANATTTYLFKNNLPECYKDIITVVLQKVNKKDYSLLKNYRLVAFKNTLGKILEKIVTKQI